LSAASSATGGADPEMEGKVFSYKAIYEYYDTQGNVTRSAPTAGTSITTPAGTNHVTLKVSSLVGSLKSDELGRIGLNPLVVFYRTEDNGLIHYRVGEYFIYNDGADSISIDDDTPDSELTTREELYTTGGVLQNDPAPPAQFCFAGGDRIFLGGLEQEDELAYSKKQLAGESVNFSDLFKIRVASFDRSPISAGGYMDGKIFIFKGHSIYYCSGDGPNELGQGSFTEPEIISSDVGCEEPRSVINVPGGLMFKSRKGIYLLDRGHNVSYIGAEVEDYNSYNVVASIISDKLNEVRFYLTSGDCLSYNYLFNAWAVLKNQTTVDADNWGSSPVSILSNTIFKETENTYLDNGASGFYSMKFTSPWLKLNEVQGYLRCYQLWIIGNNKSSHTLKCRVYTDYDDSTYEDYSLVYSSSDSSQYQFQISLPKQKVESIKFEIYDTAHTALSSGEGYELSNIQAEVGVKSGGYKLAATKSY
jgi:hypothetical protein